MKILATIILFFCAQAFVSAQAIEYKYDANGNRKQRTFLPFFTKSSKSKHKEESKQQDLDNLQNQEEDLMVYPNPLQNKLNIAIKRESFDTPADVKIYTATGTLLYHKQHNTSQVAIDVSGYVSGTYLLRIQIEGEEHEQKLIKN